MGTSVTEDDSQFEQTVSLFRSELSLCKVSPGERVAILTEGDANRARARAFEAAVHDLGAEALMVEIGGAGDAVSPDERLANIGQNALAGDPAAMQVLQSADLVIDMMLLLFSKEQLAIQQADARILMVVEPLETLERLFPTEDLRRRVEAAERRLAAARELRFTNAAGSDVTYDIGGCHILTEYGYTDTPGRWDNWGGGFVATIARPGRVDGKVVLEVGDIIYPLKKHVTSRVHFDIANGRVTAIHGGADADELKAYMEAYDDPRAYDISHIGWGLNEHCQWSVDIPGIGMDGLAYYGNLLFSTGPNTEFGGTNDTPCHLDMPMRNCTVMLDGDVIVKTGEVIPADMRAPGR